MDVPDLRGRGYAVSSSVAETALARKFKHPKGLRSHYTFRTGAKEMIPRKERLATYQFLLTKLCSPDLSPDDRPMLLSWANDALKETLKR